MGVGQEGGGGGFYPLLYQLNCEVHKIIVEDTSNMSLMSKDKFIAFCLPIAVILLIAIAAILPETSSLKVGLSSSSHFPKTIICNVSDYQVSGTSMSLEVTGSHNNSDAKEITISPITLIDPSTGEKKDVELTSSATIVRPKKSFTYSFRIPKYDEIHAKYELRFAVKIQRQSGFEASSIRIKIPVVEIVPDKNSIPAEDHKKD